jgi:tripartite-type tricarboxylate transporter receptor subunit TctC
MGVGSVGDFDTEMIKAIAKINITSVPFKGASPAITALLGGHIEAVAVALGPLISHIRAGKIKGILISTSFSEFPEIPTLKQLGYPQNLLGVWFAFFGRAGLPENVKNTLVPVIEKVVKNPSIVSKLSKTGMIQEFEGPEKLLLRMQEEFRMAEEIAKASGLKK